MRKRNKILALFLIVIIFSIPFATYAQLELESVAHQAKVDAEADANKDVNKLLWFGTGCAISGLAFALIYPLPGVYTSCLVPPAGIAGTYFYQPAPNASRFIGKTPEYVSAYTDAYKSNRGRIQSNMSSLGCVTGCGTIGLTLAVIGFALGEFQKPLD